MSITNVVLESWERDPVALICEEGSDRRSSIVRDGRSICVLVRLHLTQIMIIWPT